MVIKSGVMRHHYYPFAGRQAGNQVNHGNQGNQSNQGNHGNHGNIGNPNYHKSKLSVTLDLPSLSGDLVILVKTTDSAGYFCRTVGGGYVANPPQNLWPYKSKTQAGLVRQRKRYL